MARPTACPFSIASFAGLSIAVRIVADQHWLDFAVAIRPSTAASATDSIEFSSLTGSITLWSTVTANYSVADSIGKLASSSRQSGLISSRVLAVVLAAGEIGQLSVRVCYAVVKQ